MGPPVGKLPEGGTRASVGRPPPPKALPGNTPTNNRVEPRSTPRGRHWGQSEADSDPRGHLGVTWGVYLWACKPPLADIILLHSPDLT